MSNLNKLTTNYKPQKLENITIRSVQSAHKQCFPFCLTGHKT
jgi:hypothetical protein